MATAKIFRYGNGQAVRPKHKQTLKTLADVAKYLADKYPQGRDFPDIERPTEQQKRDLDFD